MGPPKPLFGEPNGGATRATAGVTLDGAGSGTFAFTVPAGLAGSTMTVELVDWGVTDEVLVSGPVPTAIPAGTGPTARRLAFLLLGAMLLSIVALDRSKSSSGSASPVR